MISSGKRGTCGLDALEQALPEARRSEVSEGRYNYIAAQDLAGPLAVLGEVVGEFQTFDVRDNAVVNAQIATLSERFGVFEKALLAKRGRVRSNAPQKPEKRITPLTKRQKAARPEPHRGSAPVRSRGLNRWTVPARCPFTRLDASQVLRALHPALRLYG